MPSSATQNLFKRGASPRARGATGSSNPDPGAHQLNSQNLRFILGLKLSQLRKEQGLSLKELAGKAGIAISYLNEIEKGKKYPKPEKILSGGTSTCAAISSCF